MREDLYVFHFTFQRKMKYALFLCTLSVALCFEAHFNQQPVGFIFKNNGQISNITRYEQIEFNMNMQSLSNETTIIRENIGKILDLCSKFQTGIDCNILEMFLRNKITDIENKKLLRKKRNCFCETVKLLFGSPIDEKVINQIRNDILFNRNLIKNQTTMLNRTISTQNDINNAILLELRTFENITNKIKFESKFLGLIQSILMTINDKSDVTDAIIGLIKKPHYTDALKLMGFETMDETLCKVQNSLKPQEFLASRDKLSIIKILTLSRVQMSESINGITIKIKIPIVVGQWPIFRAVPISFKGESGPMKIDTKYKYIVQGDNTSYALLDSEKWKSCQKHRTQLICLFQFTTKKSCMHNAFIGQGITKCKLTPSTLPRFIRANYTHAHVSVNNDTIIYWRCGGSEHAVKLNKNAWIQLNRNCKIQFPNEVNEKRMFRFKSRLNVTTIPLNISHWVFQEYEKDVKTTTVPSLQSLYPEIDKAHIDANKPLEKIEIRNTIIDMLIKIAILICSMIIVYCILKRFLCTK